MNKDIEMLLEALAQGDFDNLYNLAVAWDVARKGRGVYRLRFINSEDGRYTYPSRQALVQRLAKEALKRAT